MARRSRVNLLDTEKLSQEQPKVKENQENSILPEKPNNEVENREDLKNELNNIINEKDQKVDEIPTFSEGDTVKIKPGVEYDMLGRRIHNGIRNYNYHILRVRDDNYLSIECLTHCFVVSTNEVIKV